MTLPDVLEKYHTDLPPNRLAFSHYEWNGERFDFDTFNDCQMVMWRDVKRALSGKVEIYSSWAEAFRKAELYTKNFLELLNRTAWRESES